jgi:hypothetical protein
MIPQQELSIYFQSAIAAFQNAAKRTDGELMREYCIGGHRIRICFAGSALYPYIVPAFSHLESSGRQDEADLTVFIWDRTSTGIAIPTCPWSWESGIRRSLVHSDERFRITFQVESQVSCMIDLSKNVAICYMPEATSIPVWERAAPLRLIFHSWMSEHGIEMIHAGAVAIAGKAVLLTGKGGAGKSTSTMACLAHDPSFMYIGDDYCLFNQDVQPKVFSLYNSLKLGEYSLHRFPVLLSGTSYPDEISGKTSCFLSQYYPERMAQSAEISAVLVPRVTGRIETEIRPASPIESLKALSPSSIFLFPENRPAAFTRMAELVKRIPCYWLEAGTDMKNIPVIIADLIRQVK